MRELKLRYFIDLASNIGAKARADAQALEQAQKVIQGAITGTNNRLTNWNTLTNKATKSTAELQAVVTGATSKFTALDRVLTRVGSNTSTERQIGYMRRLATSIDQAQSRAARLAQTIGSGLGKVPGVVASTAAAGYVVNAALKAPLDYDTRLRGVTSTAFAGEGVGALRTGRAEINKLVVDAVRNAPGSTRDGALEAFEKLVGTGAFTYGESKQLLPTIMRTSVASKSDANDLVQAAEKMKVSFGLDPGQIDLALSKVMRAGQEGGFEIKDSAKWIGPLAPYMKGYKGMAGVEQLVTMLQQVRSTAGSNDEAANNLRNFLQKMGADSTRKDFKKQGFDLDAEMAKGVLARQTPVETYMALLDKVIAKNDPEGKARAAMSKADKAATPEQRDEQYEEIKKLYQDSAVSKIINDLQEFGGYEGLKRTKDYGQRVLGAVREENGNAVSTGFQFMTEGTGAKMQAAANEKDIAATNALESVAGPLNKLLDGTNSLAERFPTLASSAWGASVALGALSASSLLQSLLAAKTLKDVSKTTTVAGGAAGAGAAGGAASAAAVASGASRAGMFLRGALGAANPLALIEMLTGPSEADIAKLYEMDRQKAGYRGQGFDDPRRLDRVAPLPEAAIASRYATSLGMPQLDLVTLTAPGVGAASPLQAGKTTEVKVGEGRLSVDVRVSDDRVSVVPMVTQQPSLVRIDAGRTDPGSFGPR